VRLEEFEGEEREKVEGKMEEPMRAAWGISRRGGGV